MKIAVTNSRLYSNPYQKLLYSAIGDRYSAESGSVNHAIAKHRRTKLSLFHVHWEESLFAKCTTVAEAIRVRREFTARLRRYVAIGGKVIWTLHNIRPHEGRFLQTFLSLRKDLSILSHRILVHNQEGMITLQAQTGLKDLSKVTVLPHPAYLDVYEPASRTLELAGQRPANPRTFLLFGQVRAYKGIPDLVRKLTPDFMTQHQLELHICGQPHRERSFLDDLLEQTQKRSDIRYSLDAVPTGEVADLFRAHVGLIIPYHKVLTSGVAVLALTLGLPTIAPDTSSMRDLYPKASHHLLFNPRSAKDLRRAVLALADMSAEQRSQIAQDYVQHALVINPALISGALGAIYDNLLGLRLTRDKVPSTLDDTAARSRVLFLLQLISEDTAMATQASKAVGTALSNQQLALELVKATLVGTAARSAVSDELLLNNVKQSVSKFAVERARLDGAYAVRLYQNILSRLEEAAVDTRSASASTDSK